MLVILYLTIGFFSGILTLKYYLETNYPLSILFVFVSIVAYVLAVKKINKSMSKKKQP